MVFLGFVKKIWILEYLCHFIIRLHIKGRLLVKPLAIAHFSIQEYEFGVWYFSREFGCIVVRFARLKNSCILFLVCTLQTENVVIIPILFQTNGLFVLQLLILFFSIFAKKIEVKATATAVPWFSRNSIALPDNKVQSALVERSSLRTSLCKSQTSWEMNNFNPPSNFACS